MTVARFLLDTNICVFIRRQRPPSVLKRFERLDPGEAVLSAITYGELFYGAEKSVHSSRARQHLAELIELIPVMPLPAAASQSYGTIRAFLEAKGQVIGNNDLWIAAHAHAAGLPLVTSNEREFKRIASLKVLNWAD